jgi:cell division protein FtsW (lipid II flippase)
MASLMQKLAIPTIAMVWATFYLFEVMKLSAKNRYLIMPTFFIMLALYIFNSYRDIRKWKKEKAQSEKFEIPEEMRTLMILVALTVGYLIIMPHAGFGFSTVAYIAVLLFALNMRGKFALFFFPIVFTAFVYAAFRIFLRVPLPAGYFGF